VGKFELVSPFEPRGDQPKAIERLVSNFESGATHQTLLGVTGSGKTFTMAHVIQSIQRPALVISHNKTLSAQLYAELRDFFPKNAVSYFVSYYDYYQPEAYIPNQDIYIEKDASINDEIDRLRLAATSALMSREDVIVVASVSCIYGLGSPADYLGMVVNLRVGEDNDRDAVLAKLVEIQYERSATDLARATFRVRGDTIEIHPAYEDTSLRVEWFGDTIDRVTEIHSLTGESLRELKQVTVYPAKHFVMPEDKLHNALSLIKEELAERLDELRSQGKLVEAQRLEARTRYDIEMINEVGYCSGIENYSRPLAGRPPGSRPYVLLDYFPDNFLCIVDESHVTIPQLRAMHAGDKSRKETLVDYGFRLPSALDNRPLRFEEWEAAAKRVLFVSATPSPYELEKCQGEVVEQVIRPTGLVDPILHVRPARGQVNDLVDEIRKRAEKKERVLVTTLTKRMAEDLSEYVTDEGFKCQYLHSEVKTIERVEILRSLREGTFDVLIGVNLLREGLDLPEVSLVAILDADKEGFLRSETSIIQTIGRSARNVNAEVILYADSITDSMRRAIDETERRRDIQLQYNEEHDITPQTIRKEIRQGIEAELSASRIPRDMVHETEEQYITQEFVNELEEEMLRAAEALDFERAATLRDRIMAIKDDLNSSEYDARPHKKRGRSIKRKEAMLRTRISRRGRKK